MKLEEIVAFMRTHRMAVEASVSATGAPQAAIVGIVVGDDGTIFFDTLGDTRKAQNLRRHPRAAFVVGGEREERTVQLEGDADEPAGDALAAWKQRYFAVFPDGVERQAWPGLTYFRVRPRWLRYSDFSGPQPVVVELTEADLKRPAAEG